MAKPWTEAELVSCKQGGPMAWHTRQGTNEERWLKTLDQRDARIRELEAQVERHLVNEANRSAREGEPIGFTQQMASVAQGRIYPNQQEHQAAYCPHCHQRK